MPVYRTLLEQKIKERRQTFEEFAEFVEVFARRSGESGTISVRHLLRLVAGRGSGGQPLGAVRPATARLLERIFDMSVDELLSPPVEVISQGTETAYKRRSELAAARKAAGHTQESLAAELHVDRSTVVRWEAGDHEPLPYLRPKMARLLGCSQQQLADLIRGSAAAPVSRQVGGDSDGSRVELAGELAGWLSDSTRRRVTARLETWDLGGVRDRGSKLRNVDRSQVARVLADYYRDGAALHRVYVVDVDGRRVSTSILTRSEWSEMALPLNPETDRVVLADVQTDTDGRIVHVDDRRAVERLAEAAALGVRMTNKPLYRLVEVDFRDGVVSGSVALAPFGVYALTMDLLEGEIADALVAGRRTGRGDMPLRDRYLPDLTSVLDLQNRLCAGGVVGLCAIARPADPYRGPADYALLVQERSGQVVNAAGRLAVIPKGFHEPLNDVRADARIGATLRREMEEELFGRAEVDSTRHINRAAAPMHPGRLSEPMRWLLDVPGRLRTECTGFGLNLVSGNYEFAGLVVIEDEEFWPRFGGQIESNWESSGLQIYSSLDGDLIDKLVHDESWSNEGLFAFLQGIRRLREIGGDRVNLPEVVSGR